MKKILLILLIEALATTTICSVIVSMRHKDYVKTTEKLIEDIELLCEDNNISFGDTICEGDSWSDYIDACKKLRIEK